MCGEMALLMPAACAASLMICQKRSLVMARPRLLTKRILLRLPLRISGRALLRYCSTISRAGAPKGMSRSLLPLPITLTKQDERLQAARGMETSSVTLMPVE